MAVTAKDIRDRLNTEAKTLSSKGLSKSQVQEQIRNRLKKSWNTDKIRDILKTDSQTTQDKKDLWFITPWWTVLWTKKTTPTPPPVDTTTPTPPSSEVTEPIVPVVDTTDTTWPDLTIREKVASTISSQKTEEQKLKEAQEEAGRQDIVDLQKWFREEAAAVQTDLENISKWLEAEWGAITNIAASRIREARSAPLRDQLTSLVKWQELTSASLKEVDTSIDAILKAREIDRQNEVTQLSNQIEGSTLPPEEKNRLLTQLWVQTSRMKKEEELQAFAQKEQIKAQIKKQEEDSLAQTWLTLNQNLTLWKIIKNAEVKEDSIIAKSIASMLKEWKTEWEINKILNLATDKEWNFVDDTQFARREKLRKEFESKAWVKAYREAILQHQGTIATLWQASWPWDVAAVFQFMKTLDPTSVVRESEFESAANAAWVTEKVNIWNLFEKFKSWAILWEKDSKTREAFVETVNELFKIKQQNYDTLARQMINQALRDWVDPKSVVLDLDEVPWASSLTRDDYNLLNDEELTEIDFIWWYTTSDWKTFNISGFNQPEQTGWTNAIPTTGFTEKANIARTWTNVAKDTNNPWNITADSIPAWFTKEEYGKQIWATWTYLSPNGREYFVFPDVNAWTWALERDITAKISWNSRNIKPSDTLARFQRVYVWENSPWYLAVLKRITGANENTPISEIDPALLTQAVMEAEGFTKWLQVIS